MSAAYLLDDCDLQSDWAKAHKVDTRTAARYRKEPDGLPYVMFAGKVWIPRKEASEWLQRRIRRPNKRRGA